MDKETSAVAAADGKTNPEFIEMDGKGSKVIPQQKGLNDEQNALYREFKDRGEDWHRKQTKKLLWKVDWHLLPCLIMMYLLNFLDRK